MRRTIIVGDVHGCAVELEALLDRVAFCTGDRLVLVGDLVARGPDSLGVLDIARQTGAVVVLGNHEEKLLEWHDARLRKRPPVPLGRLHSELAPRLRPVDWRLLETAPLFYELPEHGALVVHAGVIPGIPLEDQPASAMTKMRGVGHRGEWVEKGPTTLWGALYEGGPHIVFGHNAMHAPQLHKWATGIDTACVYGGALTAIVLAEGEIIPRGALVRELMVVELARKQYWSAA